MHVLQILQTEHRDIERALTLLERACEAARAGRAPGPHCFTQLARAQERRTLGRNFQGYTVKAAPDVIAVGSTGISDVGGAYAQNLRALPYYYERIAAGRFATERGLRLSEDDARRRALITQVMCNFWVDLGPDAQTRYAPELERLRAFEEDGLLVRDGTQLQLTALGRLFVRNVAMVFDSYLAQAERPRFSQTV